MEGEQRGEEKEKTSRHLKFLQSFWEICFVWLFWDRYNVFCSKSFSFGCRKCKWSLLDQRYICKTINMCVAKTGLEGLWGKLRPDSSTAEPHCQFWPLLRPRPAPWKQYCTSSLPIFWLSHLILFRMLMKTPTLAMASLKSSWCAGNCAAALQLLIKSSAAHSSSQMWRGVNQLLECSWPFLMCLLFGSLFCSAQFEKTCK